MKPLHPPLQLVIEVTERLHWLDHAMRKLLMERRSTETAEHRAKIRRRHADLCDKLAETRKHVDENGAKGWQHFGENSGNTWLLWLLQHAPELADVASKLKTAKALKSREAEHLQQQLATLTTQFADVIKAVRALSPISKDGRSTAPTVWYHGERSYCGNGKAPHTVSIEQHNALQAFLQKDASLTTGALNKTGITNVSAVLAKLTKTFPGAVRRPKKKGDGYYIRVRTPPKPD